jgi:hypothetical protein
VCLTRQYILKDRSLIILLFFYQLRTAILVFGSKFFLFISSQDTQLQLGNILLPLFFPSHRRKAKAMLECLYLSKTLCGIRGRPRLNRRSAQHARLSPRFRNACSPRLISAHSNQICCHFFHSRHILSFHSQLFPPSSPPVLPASLPASILLPSTCRSCNPPTSTSPGTLRGIHIPPTRWLYGCSPTTTAIIVSATRWPLAISAPRSRR